MKSNKANQTWLKLPCLFLMVATMAFTMGVRTAPFFYLSKRGTTSVDPPRQLLRRVNLFPDTSNVEVAETQAEDAPQKQSVEDDHPSASGEAWNSDTTNLKLPSEPEECEIFKGTWIEDGSEPLYTNATCPFLTQPQNCPGNGRPDTDYLYWRWRPNECELPRFDAIAFLELIRGRTLAFIGDSVARNQFESLMCTLWQVPVKPKPNGNRKMQRWIFRDYNVKIIRIWSSWLVRASEEEELDITPKNLLKLHLDELDYKISEFLPTFDIVVVSSGHWWPKTAAYIIDGKVVGGQAWWNDTFGEKQHDVLSGFSVAMKTALTGIMSTSEYKGLTILRTFSPNHYEGGNWNTGGSCTGKTKPLTDEEVPENKYTDTLYQHQLAAVAEAEKIGLTNAKKLRVMDVTGPFKYRADGHPGPYRNNDPNKTVKRRPDGTPPPQDCLHWCMPGPIDTWNVYLFEMLRREFQH